MSTRGPTDDPRSGLRSVQKLIHRYASPSPPLVTIYSFAIWPPLQHTLLNNHTGLRMIVDNDFLSSF